ncbi:MAG: heme lyase CcmF/NrfE family subunit [Acidimicrobiia bacterium]|nr:heme lyase CcmF/NrfE family subunit [Acidimicrobiia bacterium]
MNAAIGFGFVLLGLSASALGVVGGVYAFITAEGARRRRLVPMIRLWIGLTVVSAVGAFVIMEVALFQRDYTVDYVTQVGSSTTPALFNFAALWSSLEGSLLLWVLVLGIYMTAMLLKFWGRLGDPLMILAMVVMLAVAAFFFALLAGPANPFGVVEMPADFDGPGPNPLLQNHVLVALHPPMLYFGYVGFTVPFAFSVAALATGRLGEGWLAETRRWTVAAWGFLTLGIVLGAWWSYEVLGWGGYWAWDPVENASLLPWLTGTAYIHSVMVQERRGMLRVWNLSLLCATFALTILGTFLTRSGVVESVHSFTAGAIGPLLLVFFAVVVALSVGLIAWRGDQLRAHRIIESPVSREGFFLANNLAFGALAFVVLLGTVFPLVIEAWDGTRLTIGRPYFDSMARPIALTVLFLMAAAPVLPWRGASAEVLSERLLGPALVAVAALGTALAFGARGFYPVLTFGLGGFAGGAALRQVILAVRRQGWRGLVGRTNGGMIVHLGVVLLAVGMAASESYRSEQTVRLEVGETAEVDGHEFRYIEPGAELNERRHRVFAAIEIDGGDVHHPAATSFRQTGQTVPTPSVRSGFTEDLFLVLASMPSPSTNTIDLRIIVRPLVAWIWVGGIVMAVGTALALFPGTKRRTIAATSAALEERESGDTGDHSATPPGKVEPTPDSPGDLQDHESAGVDGNGDGAGKPTELTPTGGDGP